MLTFERASLIAMAGGDIAEEEVDGYLPALKSEAVSVKVLISNAKTVESGVIVRGRTEAARNVVVRAETSGLVISQPLSKGLQVKEGQLLCELNVGTREVRLAEANARLVEAQVNNNAASRLAKSGYGSETKAIARRASLQSAEANVKLAKKEIERLKIYAPFSGLLGSDVAELGSLLQPGSECARIVKLDPIRLVGFVAESEIDKL
jgi:multidrug efflux system membrane fusion protein